MTADKIKEILCQHELWHKSDGRCGKRANLHGADLREANLCRANLCRADLRGADLCDAYLGGADLREANLCRADLRGADLGGAYLCRATLGFLVFGRDVGGISAETAVICALTQDEWDGITEARMQHGK